MMKIFLFWLWMTLLSNVRVLRRDVFWLFLLLSSSLC